MPQADVRPGTAVELPPWRLAAVRAVVNRAYGKHADTSYNVSTKAVGLRRAHLVTLSEHREDFLVSLKSDGTRYLLVLGGDDRGSFSYLVDRTYTAFEIGIACPASYYAGTVIDGELVSTATGAAARLYFLAFDAISLSGRSLRDEPLRRRRRYLESIFPMEEHADEAARGTSASQRAGLVECYKSARSGAICFVDNDFSMRAESKPGGSLSTMASLGQRLAAALVGEYDGLTFSRLDLGIMTGRCQEEFKWKTVSDHDVDLILRSRRCGDRGGGGAWEHVLHCRNGVSEQRVGSDAGGVTAIGLTYTISLDLAGTSDGDLLPLMEARAVERGRNEFSVVVQCRCVVQRSDTAPGVAVGGDVIATVVGIRGENHGNDRVTVVGTLACVEENITIAELVALYSTA
jgi:hypothetical protein